MQVIPHSLGKSEVLKGGWEVRVRFPGRAFLFFFSKPNWRNGSAPAYGAGGCGFEPHVGLVSFVVLVAQLADRPLHTRKAQGSIPCENFWGMLFSRKVERSIRPENLVDSDMV